MRNTEKKTVYNETKAKIKTVLLHQFACKCFFFVHAVHVFFKHGTQSLLQLLNGLSIYYRH